jgi:hypothetical protein
MELTPLPFSGDPVHYQWLKDGTPIARAVAPTLQIDRVQMSDAGKYTVRIFGGGKELTSDTVVTVTTDTVPPTVVKASTDSTFTSITVKYSEPVSDSAIKASNYALDKGLTISTVTRVDAQTVILATSKMAEGGSYTLTINGVQDTAGTPNTIAANTQVPLRALVYVSGMVTHRKYNGFDNNSGTNPDNLFNDPRYPGAPDRIDMLKTYEYPADAVSRDASADPARLYFDTLEGFFVPPADGNYVFFISFADRCWVYLSTDDQPANKYLIIHTEGWNDPRVWLTSHDFDTTQNRSDSFSATEWPDGNIINLKANQKYYLLMVHHDPDWAGGDWFSGTYKLDTQEDPADGSAPLLTGSVIGTYVDPSGITLSITQQPTSVSVLENATATFSVTITSSWSNPTYQWQKAPAGGAFADISGANTNRYTPPPFALTDNGSRFLVKVSVPGTTVTSDEAVVTVTTDQVPPTVASAMRSFTDDTQVTVLFSELVDSASANTAANYQISGGISVSAAALAVDGKSVVLTTSPIAKGTTATLTISNVKDLVGNQIVPGSQVAIGIQRGGLFVVANANSLNASDALVRDRLQAKGYYLQIVSATEDDVSMAAGKDIVIISSTITSGDVAGTYKNVAVPVIEWEQAIQDDMAMTTVGGSADRGTTAGQTQIDIVNPNHPMAAGLPAGPVTIVNTAMELPWGQPDTNAQVVARIVGTTDHASIYGYDKGAILTDATAAPERRVLFCMTDNVAAAMNEIGLKLFDAAINWVQNLAVPVTTPTLSLHKTEQGWSITYTGVLYSADSVDGSWTPVAGASSPYTLTLTGTQKFYRSKAP